MRTPTLLLLTLALAACRKGDSDGDGYDAPTDCNDNDATISPDATEVCDGIDNNCDGAIDETDGSAVNTWYADADSDGYGDPNTKANGCTPPVGYVANLDDCDDSSPAIHPGAVEADCTDPIDYNCDGSGGLTDADHDGYAACKECDDSDAGVNPGSTEVPYNGKDDDCQPATRDDDIDGDGYPLAQDCNDNDIFVGPDAPEIPYDGVDNDCNPATPDDDLDGDGFTKAAGDCNDASASVYPGATEIAHDGIDQNCDGIDDLDGDNDGFDASFSGGTDCNDNNAAINPSATEVPYDGVDNDCNPATRDDDIDGDGFVKAADCNDNDASVHPGAVDIAHDGVDQNCDGADNLDGDGDGFNAAADGGTDCDDTNRLVSPIAAEIPYDGLDNDCNANTRDDDLDSDGYTRAGGDCNDADAAIHPGATDIPYDGIDTDCSGGSDYDADGDGAGSAFYGKGADCDDNDPAITNCDGKSSTSPAPSCLVAHLADPTSPSGQFYLDPVGNSQGVLQAWCDMTTDGGGYTMLKVDNGAAVGAAAAESYCFQRGMQLFIPRSYAHLNSAYDVAMDTTYGPSASKAYLYILGIYPKTNGATCAGQPMTDLNPSCGWRASDGGPWFVHWNRNITEPNGDNAVGASMYYDWTAPDAAGNVRIAWHNDAYAPIGYTSQFFMCDVGDKWGPTPTNDPASCLAIKTANPNARSGVYTINPDPKHTGPFQTECDMTTDGGGWTLIGKGREGWTWDTYGQGDASTLTNLTDTSVVALPGWVVTKVAGQDMNTLADGLRIEREEMGQSARWRFNNLAQGYFWWDFTANWGVTYSLAGVGTVQGGTNDIAIIGNDYSRIWTWAWGPHNNVMGWSTGCCGTQDTDGDGIIDIQDGWQFATENHAEPFTTLWIRK